MIGKDVESAYRAFKGSVYWDKTLSFLCADIAKFEDDEVKKKLQDITDSLESHEKWELLEKKILGSIKAYSFPKEVNDEVASDETSDTDNKGNKVALPIIISAHDKNEVFVTKVQNFIHMCIEGHIIGALWVNEIGRGIDKDLLDCCYGNRVNHKWDDDNSVLGVPGLFKPYYRQYESWRSGGLEKARKLTSEKGNDIIITLLDIKRYYYSVDLCEERFRDITREYVAQSENLERINRTVYKVLQTYSELFDANGKIILPIGFLPSNILANEYLRKMDGMIAKEFVGEGYYGRYVDDMFFVMKVDDEEGFFNRIASKGKSVVSQYVLDKMKTSGVLGESSAEEFYVNGFENLRVQTEKMRFFYVRHDEYEAIIARIEDDIKQNSSEFRYLPEDEVSMLYEILLVEREGTVNRFGSVTNVSADKYGLSKVLGKNLMMAPFADSEKVDSFVNNLLKVLNAKEVIKNYTLWTSMFNCMVMYDKLNSLIQLTEIIVKSINVVGSSLKIDEVTTKIGEERIISIRESLTWFLYSNVCRALSSVKGVPAGEVVSRIVSEIKEKLIQDNFKNYSVSADEFVRIQNAMYKVRMIDRRLIRTTFEKRENFAKLSERYYDLVHVDVADDYFNNSDSLYRYLPFRITPFDGMFFEMYTGTVGGNSNDGESPDFLRESAVLNECIRNGFSDYVRQEADKEHRQIIVTTCFDGNDSQNIDWQSPEKVIRIAVANVKAKEEEIEAILKGEKPRKAHRVDVISKVIKESIREKSDFVVFPEAYIPVEFLPVLQKAATRNNMAIIGGLQHIRCGEKIYNYTTVILPMGIPEKGQEYCVDESGLSEEEENKWRYALPFFHLKKYYSPHEKELIEKYHCQEVCGSTNTLFEWKGVKFAAFCCYELTSIEERRLFGTEPEIIFGIEWNKDVRYFSNIMESITRDLCCFCVQSNVSQYGDSRILQPKKMEEMNVARVKGGENNVVIISEVNIGQLREHRTGGNVSGFKPLPAGYINCRNSL